MKKCGKSIISAGEAFQKLPLRFFVYKSCRVTALNPIE
jgi:hypothetical protein